MKELKVHDPVFVDFTWGAGMILNRILHIFVTMLEIQFTFTSSIRLFSFASQYFTSLGGSTSDLTLDLCRRAKSELNLNPNMHLTCTNMEKEKIDAALVGCKASGKEFLHPFYHLVRVHG